MPPKETKKKELLLLIAVSAAFILMLTSIGLFFKNKGNHAELSEQHQNTDGITLVSGIIANGKKPVQKPKTAKTIGSTAYFLSPSAEEMLSTIKQRIKTASPQTSSEAPLLKVMWPGYFFSLNKKQMKDALLELDTDESGFGVVLLCTVNAADYPELDNMKPGQKIWVAGEVTGMDPSGTGTITINAEYVRFDDGPTTAGQRTADPQPKK